jgi:hypothetical protein
MQGQIPLRHYLFLGRTRQKEVKQELVRVFFNELKQFYACAFLRRVGVGSLYAYPLDDPSPWLWWAATIDAHLKDQLIDDSLSPYAIWSPWWVPKRLFETLENAVWSTVCINAIKDRAVSFGLLLTVLTHFDILIRLA